MYKNKIRFFVSYVGYRNLLFFILQASMFLILIMPQYGFAVGTAFTYQGRLTDSGNPAYGVYDFEFKVYNAESDGTQIGSAVNKEDITVSNGMFTVELDFGSGIFTGSDQWLEIGVRPGISTGAYSLLTPRQKITPTPYALSLPGLWTEENTASPNLIGGYEGNSTTGGVIGGTISGGGNLSNTNKVTDNYGTVSGGAFNQSGDNNGTTNDASYGTVSGGYGNTASGKFSIVAGGYWNTADGDYSFAAGRRARANHNSSFVWADNQNDDFSSTNDRQFLIRAQGGVGINTNNPNGYGLRVAGSLGVDGNLDMATDGSNGRIVNLSSPTSPTDATNKQYVDGIASGLSRLVRNFTVSSGETVSAGNLVEFNGAGIRCGIGGFNLSSELDLNNEKTSYISIATLSSDKVVFAFSEESDSLYGKAMIGNVSGGTITFGTDYVFNTDYASYISAKALSSSKVVIAFADMGNSDYGTAIIGDISGDTITFGSEYIFNAGKAYGISACALSPTKFVVAYTDDINSDYGTAIVGDVSGTTITFGSEYVFNSAQSYYASVSTLTDSKFVVAYSDNGNNGPGEAIIGEVSGNAISFGTNYTFNNARSYWIASSALSSNKLVLAYWDNTELQSESVVGDVSGSTITFGSSYVFNGTIYYSNDMAGLSSSKFAIIFCDSDNSYNGTAVIGTVSGSVVNYTPAEVFGVISLGACSVSGLSPGKFVIGYTKPNLFYGYSRIGILGNVVGIANESGSGGESIPVVIYGVSNSHTGLVPGTEYYAQPDGNLTSAGTNTRVGLALSDTELLLYLDH